MPSAQVRHAAQFSVPEGHPEAIEPQVAEFEQALNRYQDALKAVRTAGDNINVARSEDQRAITEAAKQGKPMPDNTSANEEAALRALADSEKYLEAVGGILFGAAKNLAEAIPAVRGEWVGSLASEEAELAEEYASLLDQALERLAEIGKLRSARQWLAGFEADRFQYMESGGYRGPGEIQVRTSAIQPGRAAAKQLLTLASQVSHDSEVVR